LANTASPIASITGPISLAIKTEVCIGHPPHAACAAADRSGFVEFSTLPSLRGA
jgi:hypothetical protein